MTSLSHCSHSTPQPHYRNVFTDQGSLCHVLVGWLAGSVTGAEALPVFALFLGYQVSQAGAGDEPLYRVGGEVMEFALGMLLAHMLHGVAE